jgi:hypothetical protein
MPVMSNSQKSAFSWRQGSRLLLVLLLLGAQFASVGLQWTGGRATTGSDHLRSWPRLPSPSYGVQAFLWWNHETAERDIELVKEMGFDWIKQGFGWRDIEDITKGHFNWYFADWIVDRAEEAGLKVLARIDRQPFWSQQPGDSLYLNGPPADLSDLRHFCFALAERYRGRIEAYQVWNEPNLGREWGNRTPSAAEYVELLKACYVGIKMADAEAIVISAGLAPTGVDSPMSVPDERFLLEMYRAGAASYFDMLMLLATKRRLRSVRKKPPTQNLTGVDIARLPFDMWRICERSWWLMAMQRNRSQSLKWAGQQIRDRNPPITGMLLPRPSRRITWCGRISMEQLIGRGSA